MRALLILFLIGQIAVRAESISSLSEPRMRASVEIVRDHLYLIGGQLGLNPLDLMERIGPDREEAEEIGKMPHPRLWAASATDGTNIYIVGGEDSKVLSIADRWNPETDTWTELPPLPEPRAHLGLVWLDGKLYAIGGADGKKRHASVFIYDPALNTWSVGAEMPTARETTAVAYQGNIYVAGGYDGNSSLAAFEVYDPRKDSWMKLPDMPFLQSAHRAVVAGDSLYTFGHYHKLNRAAVYDFKIGEWMLLDLDWEGVRHAAAVVDGQNVLIIGGLSTKCYSDKIQRFSIEQLASAPRRAPDEQVAKEDAAAKPWKPTPKLEAILHAWTNALTKIQTADILLTQEHHITGGNFDQKQEILFRFDRNGPQLLIDGSSTRFVLDGTNTTLATERRRRYAQTPRSEKLDLKTDLLSPLAGFLSPDLQALFATEPFDVLSDLAKAFRWNVAESANGAEPGDWVIEGYLTMGESSPPTRLIINPETGLARSQRTEFSMIENQEGETKTNTIIVTLKPSAIKLNESLPADSFTFTPDEKWKRVERARDLWRNPDSDGRFALSGKPAPDFSLKLLDGETFKLSANTGKVVILDFWATWCGPCVKALPEMQKLWDDVQTQDVVVVGVSTDDPENEEAVRRMVKREKLTYPIGIDQDEVSGTYHVRGIPTIVLIDRTGIVQGRHVGFSSDMKKLLREQTDKLLAGESLPSAVPLDDGDEGDDEEEDDIAPTSSGRMDPVYFETIWETNIQQSAKRNFMMNHIVEILTPPSLITVDLPESVLAMRAESGEIVVSFKKPPSEKADSIHDETSSVVLRRASNEYVLARGVNKVKREKEGDRIINRLIGAELTISDSDGTVLWKQAYDGSIHRLAVLPINSHEDLLYVSDYNRFSLFTAEGVLRAYQHIHYGSQLTIFDHDGDGAPEFHLLGPRSGAYRLR